MKNLFRIVMALCLLLQQALAETIPTQQYIPITIDWEREWSIKFYIPKSFDKSQFQKGELYLLQAGDRYFQAVNAGEDKDGNTLWSNVTEISTDVSESPISNSQNSQQERHFDSSGHRGAMGSAIQTGIAQAVYNGLIYTSEYRQEIQKIYNQIAANQAQTKANYEAVQGTGAQAQEGFQKTISSFRESLAQIKIQNIQTIKYQSQDTSLVSSLKELEVILKSIKTTVPSRQESRKWGLKMLSESDKASAEGDSDSAHAYKRFAEGFADLALGLDPVTGPIRDIYETFTGKNLVTGNDLDAMDRTFAILGVVSFGFGSKLGKGIKTISKIIRGEHYSEAIIKAEKIVEHSKKIAHPASSAMAHSLYLKKLRAGMERPQFKDPGLKKFMEWFWRPNARLGNGSTAAAIRYERLTGLMTEGKSHIEKGKDGMLKLQRWLNANPNAAPSDRRAVENIIQDLMDALEGDL